jgi:hypothetical protein
MLIRSSGYFSTDIIDLRELRRSHFNRATCRSYSPLEFQDVGEPKHKSSCGGRDMRTLVDISPLLKPSERYLAAQIACDAV